jgi:hypothetical protein
MVRKFIPLAVLTLGMLLQISPAPLQVWGLEPAGLAPAAFPFGVAPLGPLTRADFNRDGSLEHLLLAGQRLTIFSGDGSVWQSPSGWTVLQAQIADLDHDGAPEAALLVWRPFRPWPVDQWLPHGGRILGFQDNAGDSCHIILIGWRGGQYREVWAGSALAEPVRSFGVADLNGDGLQELVTLEGRYTDSRTAPARALKVWEWNGFGFSIVSGMEGKFDKLALVRTGSGQILIFVP